MNQEHIAEIESEAEAGRGGPRRVLEDLPTAGRPRFDRVAAGARHRARRIVRASGLMIPIRPRLKPALIITGTCVTAGVLGAALWSLRVGSTRRPSVEAGERRLETAKRLLGALRRNVTCAA